MFCFIWVALVMVSLPRNRTVMKIPSFELLARPVQETLKTYSLLLLPLVTMYCWRSYACQKQRPRSPWAETDLNIPSLRTNFYGTRRRPQPASKERRQPTLLSSCDAYELHQWLAWQHIPKGCSSGTRTLAVTNNFLIWLKTRSARRRPCLVLET